MQYTGNIRSKLPNVGTTIFTVMSQLANQHNAINLSQGFPNFECSPELVRLVDEYMKKGMNQYAPMQGILPLREVIAAKMHDLYGANYNPDREINITAGGTQAIYAAITAVINEGDEVIVLEPAYDCYVPAIELNGGIPIFVKLKAPEYTIDWSQVKKLVSQRTRMIIINTPHNPTGAMMSAADMKELEKITRDTDIIILSDEVYEHIVFDKNEHQSVCRFPKLAERSFVVFSFGKTYHTTGWKTGYVLAPEKLMTEFRRVHQFMVFCVNTPLQYALADYMKHKEAYIQLGSFYQEKRDYFINLIKGSKFKFTPASGSYFQLLDYSGITKEKDTEYAIRLTKEMGVASVPTSVFYHEPEDNKLLRFCFAKTNETLEKAAEKLCKV
ncbi:MAG TPA: methionine aminotransferase [Bacteroidia bacterium]|jgi:methionine aminotransferase|nr:methionine aminotransferase [Bacteroidia bacterium]